MLKCGERSCTESAEIFMKTKFQGETSIKKKAQLRICLQSANSRIKRKLNRRTKTGGRISGIWETAPKGAGLADESRAREAFVAHFLFIQDEVRLGARRKPNVFEAQPSYHLGAENGQLRSLFASLLSCYMRHGGWRA